MGKPEIKVDAIRLAKGNPAFTDDFEARVSLIAKVLRSPHAHANIVDIDDSAAAALPGVHAVLHYKNTKRIKYASGGQSWPNPHPHDQVSFDNKVRHVGDRVAAVAADTVEIAEEALRLIDVTYELLPAIFDELDAMVDGAPVIHDEQDTTDIHDRERNVVHHIEAQRGNVEKGFAEADHVFEQTFRVHQVQPVPIENHISVAWLDSDERMVVRTATQVPFHTRRMLAPLIEMDIKDVRVIKPRIGGGFGAKQEMLIEDIVAMLARATRRPVKLELSREEEFMSSRTRHPQTLTYRTGVNKDGTLVSQELKIIGNTGPTAPRVHGADGQRAPRADVVQLPKQEVRLRRGVHEHPGAGCVPGLRRAAGRVRPRGPHGGHRARAGHGPDRVQAQELGGRWERARHRPAPRRAVRRRGRHGRVPEGDVIGHRGVRCPRQAGQRMAPDARRRAGQHRPTGRTSAGGSALRSACTAPRFRSWTWAAAASRSTTTARSTC